MKRLFIFLLTLTTLGILITGCTKNESVELEEGTTFNTEIDKPTVVEGEELMCLVDTKSEAEEIAKLYDIELVTFADGVATFHTDKNLQEVIQTGKDNNWSELSINHIIYLDDPVAPGLDLKDTLTETTEELSDEDKAKLEDMAVIDEQISKLVESDDFQNSDDIARYDILFEALHKLQEEGRISALIWVEDEKMFSFEYAYGAKGSWSLHPNEYDPMMN